MSIVVKASRSSEGIAALKAAAEVGVLKAWPVHVVGHISTRGEEESHRYREIRADVEHVLEDAVRLVTNQGAIAKATLLAQFEEESESVLHVARLEAAKLIVVALRPRSRVGKLLLGSTPQDILMQASCPVLAIKAGYETSRGV